MWPDLAAGGLCIEDRAFAMQKWSCSCLLLWPPGQSSWAACSRWELVRCGWYLALLACAPKALRHSSSLQYQSARVRDADRRSSPAVRFLSKLSNESVQIELKNSTIISGTISSAYSLFGFRRDLRVQCRNGSRWQKRELRKRASKDGRRHCVT